jgi:hypothetical protein
MRAALLAALLIARMSQPSAPVPASVPPEIDLSAAAADQADGPVRFPGAVTRPLVPARPPIFVPRVLGPMVPFPQRVIIAPRPRTGKGAVIGALIGAGAGAIVGYAAPLTHLTHRDGAVLGALSFGGLGGFVGHQFDF